MRNGMTYLSNDWLYREDDALFRRDFKTFKDNGINLIIVCIRWAQLEPTKGNYNDALLDRLNNLVSIADQYGIKVAHNMHTVWQASSTYYPDHATGNYICGVVRNEGDDRATWLAMIRHYVKRLQGKSNVHSFQVFNEPVNAQWTGGGCPAGQALWIETFEQTYAAAKMETNRPIAARIAVSTRLQFGERLWQIFDYNAINIYWRDDPDGSELQYCVEKSRQYGKEVFITEFGVNTENDADQVAEYERYFELFTSLGIPMTAAWWTASERGPSAYGYNLLRNGVPRPAFYVVAKYNDPTPEFPKLPVRIITDIFAVTAGSMLGYNLGGTTGAGLGAGLGIVLGEVFGRVMSPPVETTCFDCEKIFEVSSYNTLAWCPYCGKEQIVRRG